MPGTSTVRRSQADRKRPSEPTLLLHDRPDESASLGYWPPLQRGGADGLACKPGSVSRPLTGPGGRPSIYGCRCRHPPAIYPRTRAGRPRTCVRPMPEGSGLLDLAPGGVCRAGPVARVAGGLLHHRFTLTGLRRVRRSVLCGTFPRVTPGGCYPPPCPVEPGLSSAPYLERYGDHRDLHRVDRRQRQMCIRDRWSGKGETVVQETTSAPGDRRS